MATVTDIARHAGVSVGTVSRVLNGATNISPDNLDSVQRAISKLGYKKHLPAPKPLMARKLAADDRTGNIGMVFAGAGQAWTNHPLFAAYTLGVEQACQQSGVHALVEISSDDSMLPRCVVERKIDGLLVKSTSTVPAFVKQLPADLPVVFIGLNDPSVALPQVAPDSLGSGWLVADYLWQRGHRRIAFVCTNATHPQFITRQQGIEGYLRQRDGYDPALVIMRKAEGDDSKSRRAAPESTPPDLEAEVKQLFFRSAGQRPTAIVTANDWMAHGLYRALARHGLRVPQDVSVVGFDNMEPLCTVLEPALTSYDVSFAAQSKAAAFDLFHLIENPAHRQENSVRLVRGNIVERQSVAEQQPSFSV
ncbi:LacI family DNA-binding transcriptional regulator [Geminisphaera colitermitum]|uniref:LacI family DNA-binding transcriptional regulator n=1 Tax=Geminisphaera colitermitum TaxID=1148786 RepID=UPI0001965196|nr:LacI family DNA-binding transcriptional regulator [Geminisphaera colitermitum]